MHRKAFPATRKDGMMIGGMDLREYYAAKALQGLIAHNGYTPEVKDVLIKQAFEIADAMIDVKVPDTVERVELGYT